MILFYLKKIVGMPLMPIPLTLIGLLAGLLLLKRRPWLGKSLIFMSALFLALTSWHPVADRLLAPFEDDYARFDIRTPVDSVVVLGGCHSSDASVPPAAQLCSTSLFRLTEGLRILRANPQAELLVSGYAGKDTRSHAEVMREVAISMGTDEARIRIFPQARDTEEEAAQMAIDLTGKTFALVTDASHLPRAMTFFQHEQLSPLPAPAVVMSQDHSDWRINARAAVKSERAFYEGIGQAWQWLKGLFW